MDEGDTVNVPINHYHSLTGLAKLKISFVNPDTGNLFTMERTPLQIVSPGITGSDNLHCNSRFCLWLLPTFEMQFFPLEASYTPMQIVLESNTQSNGQNFGLLILEPEQFTPLQPEQIGTIAPVKLVAEQQINLDMNNFFTYDDYITVSFQSPTTGQNVFLSSDLGGQSHNGAIFVSTYRFQGRSFLAIKGKNNDFNQNFTVTARNNQGVGATTTFNVQTTKVEAIETEPEEIEFDGTNVTEEYEEVIVPVGAVENINVYDFIYPLENEVRFLYYSRSDDLENLGYPRVNGTVMTDGTIYSNSEGGYTSLFRQSSNELLLSHTSTQNNNWAGSVIRVIEFNTINSSNQCIDDFSCVKEEALIVFVPSPSAVNNNFSQVNDHPLFKDITPNRLDKHIERIYINDYIEGRENYNLMELQVILPDSFGAGFDSITMPRIPGRKITLFNNFSVVTEYNILGGMSYFFRSNEETPGNFNTLNDYIINGITTNVILKNSFNNTQKQIQLESSPLPFSGLTFPAIGNSGLFSFQRNQSMKDNGNPANSFITTYDEEYFILFNDFYSFPNKVTVNFRNINLTLDNTPEINVGAQLQCNIRFGIAGQEPILTPLPPSASVSYTYSNINILGNNYLVGETYNESGVFLQLVSNGDVSGMIVKTQYQDVKENMSILFEYERLEYVNNNGEVVQPVLELDNKSSCIPSGVVTLSSFTQTEQRNFTFSVEPKIPVINMNRNSEEGRLLDQAFNINTNKFNEWKISYEDTIFQLHTGTPNSSQQSDITDFQNNTKEPRIIAQVGNDIITIRPTTSQQIINLDDITVRLQNSINPFTLENTPRIQVNSKNVDTTREILLTYIREDDKVFRQKIFVNVSGVGVGGGVGGGVGEGIGDEIFGNLSQAHKTLIAIFITLAGAIFIMSISTLEGGAKLYGGGTFVVASLVIFAYIGWLPVWIPVIVGLLSVGIIIKSVMS